MAFVYYNGYFVPDDQNVLPAADRSYRYGEGIFETFRFIDGSIPLGDYHFERLFSSLELLRYRLPPRMDALSLQDIVSELCRRNNCYAISRVRLSVSGGIGMPSEPEREAIFLIESRPLLIGEDEWPAEGGKLGLYTDARKAADKFSSLKSANYLPYSLAARHAAENGFHDSLVLDTRDFLADTSRANIFIYNNGRIQTPSLDSGCVAGVMRRHLIKLLPGLGYEVEETQLKTDDLRNAEEVFLTNAIGGIFPVGRFEDKNYITSLSTMLRDKLVEELFV